MQRMELFVSLCRIVKYYATCSPFAMISFLLQVRVSNGGENPPDISSLGKMAAPMFRPQQANSEDSASTPRLGGFLRKRGLRTSVTAMIQMRRMSKVMGMFKGTGSATSTQPRPVNLENTYKMKPDDGTQFSSPKVIKEAESILKQALNGVKYNPEVAKELSSELSTVIKDRVKQMGFPRYKIVCQILIGEKDDQGLEVATRCLWNEDTDNWACATYTNDSLFAVAMIHGVYFE